MELQTPSKSDLGATVSPRDLARARQRIVGSVGGAQPGPTLVCVGSVHGNEWSGVLALQRVFAELEERQIEMRGDFIGLAGNLGAMVLDERYVEHDLNRHWLPHNIARVQGADLESLGHEDREMKELLGCLDEIFEAARGSVFFLDLHTSSAVGDPFVCIGDTMRNRRFAEGFCVPIILGLEEQIDGSLLEYVNNLGHVTMGVEAGQHRADSSIDHHEASVWLGLVNAGMVDAAHVPQLEAYRQLLLRDSHHLHGFMEVRHRHPLVQEDGFQMEAGFVNFDRVEVGQLLARDQTGAIQAAESGRILLPLYQGLGNDGFFIAREVKTFWLRVSSFLRRLPLDRVVHWLPGVERHPEQAATLVIHTNLARWFALEVFHLLGYRKRRAEGDVLVVSRRRFDSAPPSRA